ncbi:MAG: hypothetical protein U1E56_04930 [Bauldia sp.]
MNPTAQAVLEWFKQAWPGPEARASKWLFGFGETIHFMGICVLFGALIIFDLRLLGFFKGISGKTALAFVPYALAGFVMLAATGWMFFTSNPVVYYSNPAFLLKMLAIVLAGLNALAFFVFDHSKVVALGPGEDTSAGTKWMAGGSLALWLTALLLGRFLPLFVVSQN